ncbi:MAG TPA: ABC transporter permease [Planctomycetota bacterium]|nr:ABC transporter permease [Planctomycetota bacterium]HRR82911.1 ABC transporter permease [Planctomycetota bacterium]HRT93139.1 ABC transporter permease [Planctomycetota bacterium]
MRFVSLALKNLLRRPMRSALTVAGVGLAVMVTVSLSGFILGYRRAINESIDKLGFQVMIMAKGCPYEAATMMLKGGTGLLYLPEEVYTDVQRDPAIQAITPVFIGVAEKEAGGIGETAKSYTVVTGIEAKTYVTMKPWLEFATGTGFDGGRWFAPDSTDEVVMGYEAATYEQRKVGDEFYVSVAPAGKTEPVMHRFKVVGVLARTGTQDDGTVFMPYHVAQKVFGRPEQLTIVGIKMKDFTGPAVRDFTERWIKLPEVQVVGLEQVKSTLVMLVGAAQVMLTAVAMIAVVVATIGVINTILMSVYERTGEIGIMKAIGAARGDIFQLIWLETLAVCTLGALVGCVIAVLGVRVVEKGITTLLDIGVRGSVVSITPEVLGAAIAGTIVVGFFAGLYPAWRAASMRPVEAIREGID